MEVVILSKPSRQLIMNEDKVVRKTRLHSLQFVLSMNFNTGSDVDAVVAVLHLLATCRNYSFFS